MWRVIATAGEEGSREEDFGKSSGGEEGEEKEARTLQVQGLEVSAFELENENNGGKYCDSSGNLQSTDLCSWACSPKRLCKHLGIIQMGMNFSVREAKSGWVWWSSVHTLSARQRF